MPHPPITRGTEESCSGEKRSDVHDGRGKAVRRGSGGIGRQEMNGEAAAALGVSLRQLKRIKAKVKKEGPSGIKHGNSGRLPAGAFPAGMKSGR